MNLKTATTFLMALVGSASAFGIGKHHSFGKVSSLVMNKDKVHLPRANQHKLHVTTTVSSTANYKLELLFLKCR